MSQPEHYDALILGSGTAGKLTAWHMGRVGKTDRGRRAQVGRRRLPQYRVHAEQERDP